MTIKDHSTTQKAISVISEILSFVFLLLSLYPIFRYGSLEGLAVPQHYSPDGAVDIWSDRTMLLFLSLISVLMYALMTAFQRHPKFVNIPFSDKLSDGERTALGSSIAQMLKIWVMAVFAYLSVSSYRIALAKEESLNRTYTWIILLCALVHLAVILTAFFRTRE